MFTVILFYKYVHISDPESLVASQRLLCRNLGLTGRILIAEEGINGTLEGSADAIEKYCSLLLEDPRMADIQIKKSAGTGKAFPKLLIKARSEIVASHLGSTVDPRTRTGKYLSAEELHAWFESTDEFYIIDMRNDYETRVGMFENSIPSRLANFRFLPEVLNSIRHLQDKKVLTVCTGGVRCEKASAFLIENGFSNVYQLKDGIVTYMEKYPNQHFKGKLYVFDNRILISFNAGSPEHEVIGKCYKCGAPSEHFINCAWDECHLHFICCNTCLTVDGVLQKAVCCSGQCEQQIFLKTVPAASVSAM